ncbi:hypothetical protein MTO96_042865 [Rhipicephalus appendiculatus]
MTRATQQWNLVALNMLRKVLVKVHEESIKCDTPCRRGLTLRMTVSAVKKNKTCLVGAPLALYGVKEETMGRRWTFRDRSNLTSKSLLTLAKMLKAGKMSNHNSQMTAAWRKLKDGDLAYARLQEIPAASAALKHIELDLVDVCHLAEVVVAAKEMNKVQGLK